MKIVADENIPLVRKIFSNLGNVTLLPGRTMGPREVEDADILLVRSVTQVNEALLENSQIRFVGTATSGQEHIDQDYLKARNIVFKNAVGCNANSVVEYVLSALFTLDENHGIHWQNKKVGIVGLGNVGKALLHRMQRLGVQCLGFDPFLEQAPEGIEWCPSLKQLLLRSDIITLHTPLTMKGEHPTWHMINSATLKNLKQGAVLINSARGAVIDSNALLTAMRNQAELFLVFDVWENEPDINFPLMHHAAIATPHIAGYSLDGKVRGIRKLYREICQDLGVSPKKGLETRAPEPSIRTIRLKDGITLKEAVSAAVPTVYDVRIDDLHMRQLMYDAKPEDRAKIFDQLRKFYPERREFESLIVQVRQEEVSVFNALAGYGFKTERV